MEPMVLTPEQAAAALQVDVAQIDRLRRRRDIAAVRVGNQVRYRVSDIEAYIASRTKPCRQSAGISPGLDKKPEATTGTSTGTNPAVPASNDARQALAIAKKLTRRSDALLQPEPKPQTSPNPSGTVLSFRPTDSR